jgi:hypothetical protein
MVHMLYLKSMSAYSGGRLEAESSSSDQQYEVALISRRNASQTSRRV